MDVVEAAPEVPVAGVTYLIHAALGDLRPRAASFREALSADEMHAVSRFRFERDRERSTLARGLLRATLGRMTGQRPELLAFEETAFGKPSLKEGPSFNVAHSGEHVLIAVRSDGRVGVDIEVRRDLPDVEALARTVFTNEELEELAGFAPAERHAAFFRGWARKEAFIKGVGKGLSIPLKQFAVSLAERVPAGDALRFAEVEGEETAQWRVVPLPELPDAAQAVAVEGDLLEIRAVPAVAFIGR